MCNTAKSVCRGELCHLKCHIKKKNNRKVMSQELNSRVRKIQSKSKESRKKRLIRIKTKPIK